MSQTEFKKIPSEEEMKMFPTPKTGVKPRKRGRPKGTIMPTFEPTEDQRNMVKMMSVNGLKHPDQAGALGISYANLKKHFQHELDFGKKVACSKVAGALYKSAIGGSVPAQIFWLKSQGGWREADRLELTGKDGKDLMNLTDTEKEQRLLHAILRAKKIDPKMPTMETEENPEGNFNVKDTK